MAFTYEKVKEIEFIRMINTGTITKFFAQEDINNASKFCIMGLDPVNRIAYTLRHGRTSEYRSRGSKYIEEFFRKNNIIRWETQLKNPDV